MRYRFSTDPIPGRFRAVTGPYRVLPYTSFVPDEPTPPRFRPNRLKTLRLSVFSNAPPPVSDATSPPDVPSFLKCSFFVLLFESSSPFPTSFVSGRPPVVHWSSPVPFFDLQFSPFERRAAPRINESSFLPPCGVDVFKVSNSPFYW